MVGVEEVSDYTPTTEEELLNFKSNAELRKTAEFDRWLAEVKAQERKIERERIIGLLMANELDRTILMAIVDLIEGEEK